jgi:RNA polymerase subunit RPABC4/transcription elongation factor Spt4
MKCPSCGREYQDENGRCPVCAAPSRVIREGQKKLLEPTMQVLPKSIGICPECGKEQIGTLYRMSPGIANFLKVKGTDTFLPDKHACVRKAIAG